MANLAIKGHATRGKEVIEILEMLSGKNIYKYNGNYDNLYYYIGKNNIIYYCHNCKGSTIFTLEKFLKKFPYKVGDKVIHDGEVLPIIGMKWDFSRNIVIYTMKYNYGEIDCYDRTWMRPYKEETMEEIIKIDIPKGYEFAGVDDDKQQVVFTKIQPKYPKTYVECAKLLDCFGAVCIDGYKGELLDKFQELLICRDAYWKIAGEEMGLGKPWEPNWNDDKQGRYIIMVYENKLYKDISIVGTNFILVFPTEEMRDAFFENFKSLIEECKELL